MPHYALLLAVLSLVYEEWRWSQMLRRVVSKFQGSPPDLCTPFNGNVARQMDEREQSLYTHPCKSSLPRVEMDLAIANMRSARAWTDHVPERTEEQEFM